MKMFLLTFALMSVFCSCGSGDECLEANKNAKDMISEICLPQTSWCQFCNCWRMGMLVDEYGSCTVEGFDEFKPISCSAKTLVQSCLYNEQVCYNFCYEGAKEECRS